MFTFRRFFGFSGLLAAFTLSGGARAESVDGRVRLFFEGGVLDYQSLTASGSGIKDTSTSTTQWGLASGSFGPGIAYGVNDWLLLGAQLFVLSRTQSWDNDARPEVTSSGTALYGNAEFLFGDGSLRPFIGPVLGYESTTSGTKDAEATMGTLVLGAKGGLHAFATSSFSIDPNVTLAYTRGSIESNSTTLDLGGFTFGIHVALSGWLGDAPASSEAPAEESSSGDVELIEKRSEATPPPKTPFALADPSESRHAELLLTTGKLMLDVDDAGNVRFRYLLPGASSDAKCARVAFASEATTEVLPIEQASVVGAGSSSMLAVLGVVPEAALMLASQRAAVKVITCDTEDELDASSKRVVRQLRSNVERLQRVRAGAPFDRASAE